MHARKHFHLPKPAMEEEILATDYTGSAADRGHLAKKQRDQRKLLFHISNNEGFEVKSDSWQGRK